MASEVQLGQFITTQKGYAFKSKWYSDDGHPIVKVSDFTSDSIDVTNLVLIPQEIANDYRKYELNPDDVIIQTVGSWPSNPASVVGKTIRVPKKASGALLNQNAVKVDSDDSLDKGFLYYLLRNDAFKEYIVGTAQGAASQASITLDSIRAFLFICPPLLDQKNIANTLSAYDNLIENNNRRIAILEDMAQSLYQEWFVKYRFPGHQNTKFKESSLGLIPEGWVVKKLFDMSLPTYGFAFKSRQFNANNEGTKVVRIRNVPTSDSVTYTLEVPKKEEQVLKNGDLLIGMDGDFHMGKWSGGHAYLCQRVVKITPNDEVSPYFVFLSFRQPIINLNKSIVGTTVAHLGDKHLQEINIVVPEESIFKNFSLMVDPIFNKELNLHIRNKNLKKQRNSLLPKLISGKIRM